MLLKPAINDEPTKFGKKELLLKTFTTSAEMFCGTIDPTEDNNPSVGLYPNRAENKEVEADGI